MKHVFTLFIVTVVALSCNKDASSSKYPYFYLTVDGTKKPIGACGTTAPVSAYLKDTAVFVSLGCGGRRVGFFLRGTMDGTYPLDQKSYAWYTEGPAWYSTDSLHKGTLTIRTIFRPSATGSAAYTEGEIAFGAIDKSTGKTIRVTKGKFFLTKYQY